MNFIGIYKITSPSGKVYIGQSWNIKKRFSNYKGYHCPTQVKLHNSLVKYGSENHKFEIIHNLPKDVNQNVMDSYELFYTDTYKNCNIELLNLKEGGLGGRTSDETKEKLRNILGPINRKRAKTTEARMHQSNGGKANLGVKRSLEAIQNMRATRPNNMKIGYYDKNNKLIDYFPSQSDAARKLNISQVTISLIIRDNRKSRKGYTFKKIIL